MYSHSVSLKDPPIETLGALTGPLPDIRPLDHSGSRTCLSKCDFGDDRVLLYHRPTFDTKSISGGCIVLDDCTTTVSTGRLVRLGIRKDFNWRWDEELTITKSRKRRGCRSCVIGSRLLVLCMARWIKKETVWRDLSAKNFEWRHYACLIVSDGRLQPEIFRDPFRQLVELWPMLGARLV